MKKKYVLKKETALQQQVQQKQPQLSIDIIRRFISQAKLETLPKVQIPRRKVVSASGLQRASSTHPSKPSWRAEDGPEMELKRQLTASSSNGGWTAGIRQQSLERNRALLNELKFTLNILAEDNYSQLLQHLCKCLSDNPSEAGQLLQQVMLCKAEFETKYHSLYAKLCRSLKGAKFEMQGLSRQLVERLQHLSEEEYADNKQRKNFLNTLEFFGELFLAGVVDRASLNEVTHQHLNEYFASKQTNLKNLEVLVVLYNSVGRYQKTHPEEAMRISKVNSKSYPTDSEMRVTFADVFALFEDLTETVEDTRLWSLIINMLERRSNKWPKGQNAEPQQHEPIQTVEPASSCNQLSVEEKEGTLRQSITKAIEKANVEELHVLARQDQLIFADMFVLHFFRHRLPQIDQLVQLMAELVESKVVQLDCLVQSFELKFEQLVLEQADFPLCKRALCKLFHPYAQSGLFSFQNLREFICSDEQEEFVEALESMMDGLLQSERES